MFLFIQLQLYGKHPKWPLLRQFFYFMYAKPLLSHGKGANTRIRTGVKLPNWQSKWNTRIDIQILRTWERTEKRTKINLRKIHKSEITEKVFFYQICIIFLQIRVLNFVQIRLNTINIHNYSKFQCFNIIYRIRVFSSICQCLSTKNMKKTKKYFSALSQTCSSNSLILFRGFLKFYNSRCSPATYHT